LERLDPNPEYWNGKRGACCGVFQQVIAKKAKKEQVRCFPFIVRINTCAQATIIIALQLRDVVAMLRGTTNSPQAEWLVRVMTKWAAENHLKGVHQL
jgi:intraflagellar transport protein 56